MNSTLTARKSDGTTRPATTRQPQAQVRRTSPSARRLWGALVGTGVAALLACGAAWAPGATAQTPTVGVTLLHLCAANSRPQLVVPGGPTRPTRRTRTFSCSVTPVHGPMARSTAIS
ncbi:MAG: hypothetical protein ABSB52_13430 [Acidimicrobiales bacterium]